METTLLKADTETHEWKTGKPLRGATGLYAYQEPEMDCKCCHCAAHWNGADWYSNLHTPGRYRTLLFPAQVARWRKLQPNT